VEHEYVKTLVGIIVTNQQVHNHCIVCTRVYTLLWSKMGERNKILKIQNSSICNSCLLCEIWGYHCREDRSYGLLGCDTM